MKKFILRSVVFTLIFCTGLILSFLFINARGTAPNDLQSSVGDKVTSAKWNSLVSKVTTVETNLATLSGNVLNTNGCSIPISATNGNSSSWFTFNVQAKDCGFGYIDTSTKEFVFTMTGTYSHILWGESLFRGWQRYLNGGAGLTNNYANPEDMHIAWARRDIPGDRIKFTFLTNHNNPLTGRFWFISKVGQ